MTIIVKDIMKKMQDLMWYLGLGIGQAGLQGPTAWPV